MPALRPASRFLRIRLLAGGHLVIGLTLVLGVAAAESGVNLLHGLVALLLAFQAVSGFRSYIVVRGVDVAVGPAPRLDAGGEATLEVVLSNRKRRSASLSIEVEVETGGSGRAEVAPAWVGRLDPGADVRLRLPVRGLSRGVERLGSVVVSSRWPCDLFRRSRRYPWGVEVLVRPARRALSLAERAGEGDPRTRVRAAALGEGEFRGLRPFREGDSPRAIHWRSSARTGSLVVREDESSRPAPWCVVLAPGPADTALDPVAARMSLDAEVEAAAAVCRVATESGRPVELRIAGDARPRRIRGRRALEDALDALSRFEASDAAPPGGPFAGRAFLVGARAKAPADSRAERVSPSRLGAGARAARAAPSRPAGTPS